MAISENQSADTPATHYGRLNPNTIVGVVFFILALVFLYYIIPSYISAPPFMQHPLLSPRFLPQVAGWSVLVLSLVLMVSGLRVPPEREPGDELRRGVSLIRQALMVGAGVVYAFFFEQLGAIGSGVLACVLLFLASGLRNPLIYLLAIAFPVLVTMLFIYLLNVPLPVGELWEAWF